MKSSILNALRSCSVKQKDIDYLKQRFKNKGFTVEDCDKELVRLGYDPIFVVEYDEGDDDYYEYDSYEKRVTKAHFDD